MRLLLLVLLAGAAVHCVRDGVTRGRGHVEGIVLFAGLPCPEAEVAAGRASVPPCDGPYPGYLVVVREEGSADTLASARTDSAGFYRISLPEGGYVVGVQNGPRLTDVEDVRFQVHADSVTRVDLTVSTGIQ
jgi:hypothetical protein